MAFTTTDGHTSGASAMRVEQGQELLGLKAICAYLGKSENTVRRLIREQGLPAAKIGGEWQSHTGLIRDWRLKKICSAPLDVSKKIRYKNF